MSYRSSVSSPVEMPQVTVRCAGETGDFCSAEQSKYAAVRLWDTSHPSSVSDYACRLSIATLCAVTKLSEQQILAQTRSAAHLAFARQVAMYLAHTKFGISFTEVGRYFQRDRSTVAHACGLVEDRRDDAEFDADLSRMEHLVDTAMEGASAVQMFLSSHKPRGRDDAAI